MREAVRFDTVPAVEVPLSNVRGRRDCVVRSGREGPGTPLLAGKKRKVSECYGLHRLGNKAYV